ncbi:MAG TPA: acyl-CoA dehydrogenase family protein, partial [Polyangiales bacterium]|nr:acyl-CoA dehydrogenase family protein [Polyangiales bacterium]
MSKSPIATSLSMLNKFSGSPLVHKLGIYKPAQTVAHVAVREGFKAAGAAVRQWKEAQKLIRPERLANASRPSDLFDLNPTEEQQMIRDMAQRFAREVLRPAAYKADEQCSAPEGFDAQLSELGLAQFAVPESLGGTAAEASVCTGVLVAEDLAQGDVGLALAALAPIGVANALVRWGSADQQAKYLPAFA